MTLPPKLCQIHNIHYFLQQRYELDIFDRQGLMSLRLVSYLPCSEGDPEFLTLQLLPPECWDYGHVPSSIKCCAGG